MKTTKTCIYCKDELPHAEFLGMSKICNFCKDKSKSIKEKMPESKGLPSINVGRKGKHPIKFYDEKHSNIRTYRANIAHSKKDELPPSRTKVKIKIEDQFGRTNKIVGKRWDKQLAEIKQKIKEHESTRS